MNQPRLNPILTIIKNIGALTAAKLLGRLLSFVIVAIIARIAGADGLGGYATANAIAGFFLIFADIGLAPRFLREASADIGSTNELYTRSTAVKLATTLFCGLFLGILFFVLPYETWVRDLTILLSVAWVIRSYSQMNHTVLRAREYMELEAISVTAHTVVFIGLSGTALAMDFSLVSIGWASILAAIVEFGVSNLLARRFATLRFGTRPDLGTIREAAPYTATLLAHIAFAQGNIVILSLVASQSLVGEFTSISRILMLAAIVPELITLAILPSSARVFGQSDPSRFRRMTTSSLRILLIIAGGGAIALMGVSETLLGWIYGEQLAYLFPYLQIGALYIVFQFMSGTLGMVLTAANRQGDRARAVAIALVSSGVLFYGLTMWLGVLGSVLALVIAECVLVLAEGILARDLLDMDDLVRCVAWVGGATAIGIGSHLWLAGGGHVWAAAIVPALAYSVILLVSNEPRRLIEIVKNR